MKIIAKILTSLVSFLLLTVGSLTVIYFLLVFLVEVRLYLSFDSAYSTNFDLGRGLTRSFVYLIYIVTGVVSVFLGSKLSRKMKRQDTDTRRFAFKAFIWLLFTVLMIGIGLSYLFVKSIEADRRLFQMMKEEGYDLTTEDARQKTLEKIRRDGGQ